MGLPSLPPDWAFPTFWKKVTLLPQFISGLRKEWGEACGWFLTLNAALFTKGHVASGQKAPLWHGALQHDIQSLILLGWTLSSTRVTALPQEHFGRASFLQAHSP